MESSSQNHGLLPSLISLSTSVTGWAPPECSEGAQSPAVGIPGQLYFLEFEVYKDVLTVATREFHGAGIAPMQGSKGGIS